MKWQTFGNADITPRSIPVRLSYIDASTIRLQGGSDYYLQEIIRGSIDAKDRVALSMAYRRLKELFGKEPPLEELNKNLTTKRGVLTDKQLAIALDMSQRSGWDSALVPHLDDIPFQAVGKGEQNSLKIMLALERKAEASDVVLLEEPENHLSFSSMNVLLHRIRERCKGKQVVATTHSAYVLNKLGVSSLVLLRNNVVTRLTSLQNATQEYFEKLAGYDTLRLILAQRAILVEGPSDELIVQKAYRDTHQKLPIEDGVDVISVGTAFLRFLEIAKPLGIPTTVVTDNDGNHAKVAAKYAAYKGVGSVKICYSTDNALNTLEPHMAAVNDLAALNTIFGKNFASKEEVTDYMTGAKTDSALKLFGATGIKYPQYVLDAIA